MRSRPASLAVVVLVTALLVTACSASDGRSLPAPGPHQTTTSVSAPVVGQPSDGDSVVEVFSLSSLAFTEGGVIPPRYTCGGDNLSPPLAWASTPPAAELALVVRDQDAGGFVHWVVTGIDPAVQGFAEGGVPESAVESANSSGSVGWFGPCPPAGSGPHTYAFALHAMPEPIALDPGLPATDAAQLVEGASSEHATLSASVTG